MNAPNAQFGGSLPGSDLVSLLPAALGVSLVIFGLLLMVRAVRERSTPLSLLGIVILAGGAGILVLAAG